MNPSNQPNPSHARFQELACLRLYDELSPEEERVLARHLAACAECRSFDAGLAETLGVMTPANPESVELPEHWAEGLTARLAKERRMRFSRLAAPFAAGLAAGLLAMAMLRTDSMAREESHGSPLARSLHSGPPFELRDEPPPPTTSRGAMAHVGAWLKR